MTKSIYLRLGYDELSNLINDSYAKNPDMRLIAREYGISVNEVFEITGWKDWWDYQVNEE